MRHRTGRSRIRPPPAIPALLALGIALAGCRLDVGRVRSGKPLDFKAYEQLTAGESSRKEALDALGAPDRVRWESGRSRLTWEHLDETLFQARFQFPISFFGYRHDIFRYFQNRDYANTMDLVFDDRGILEEKALRLPEAYREEEVSPGGWRLQLTPRLEHSVLLVGDGDFADYNDIFENGYLVGLEAGVQPVAPVTLALGGRYQRFEGETVVAAGGERVAFGDLELYTAEVILRLQVPLSIFFTSENLKDAWTLFLQKDPRTHDGFILFVEGGIGATLNGNVPVTVDGGPQNDFYDAGFGLSSSTTAGLEYSWRNVSIRAGVTYRTTDGFDDGDSGIPDDGDSFQTLGAMASLALKF